MSIKNSITINNTDYYISFLLTEKQVNDKSTTIELPWSNIDEFTYIDDISNVGLFGTLVYTDFGNIFTEDVFQNIDKFLLQVIISNINEDYKILIYFNIQNIQNIQNKTTSSATKYNLQLVESFIGESSVRNFKAFQFISLSANNQNNYSIEPPIVNQNNYLINDFNYPNITKRLSSYILTNPNHFDFGETVLLMSKDYNNIIDIDNISFEKFSQDADADTIILGKTILDSILPDETCFDVFKKLNSNLYCYPFNSSSTNNNKLYSFGTVRMENLYKAIGYDKNSNEQYSDDKLNGSRKIIIKNIRDIFAQCFQDNTVYESFISNISLKNNKVKSSFKSLLNVNSANILPVNKNLISQEWCDTLVISVNNPDNIASKFFSLKDIVDGYQNNFLFNNEQYKTPINYNNEYKFKGLSRKFPLLNSDDLCEYYSGKMLKNILLLNGILSIKLTGNIYRKANEIIYIDVDNTEISTGTNVYNNYFKDNYYYVSRVIHSFKGSNYVNEMNLTNICYKIKK